ncbi:hypothetical protein [Candidatus Methylacidiphilum infernorum]|uniref:hypothetical protein n=1 Tax=Candidatus Methylacidiphilum infernorum TaxID=511746 RepID=UPI001F5C177F|nr:hypothetical protein [Candidatus Methylacidiphilum infernorum]
MKKGRHWILTAIKVGILLVNVVESPLSAGEGSEPTVPLKIPNPSIHSSPNTYKGGVLNKENNALNTEEANPEPKRSKKIAEDQQKENNLGTQNESLPQPLVPNNELPQPIILDFRIRELMELKKIAREIGGSLVITIEPKGITAADLIVPLRNSGMFNVESKDGRLFIVTSNGEQQKRIYEEEIAALSRRQSALLQNISVLQNLMNANNGPRPNSSDSPSPIGEEQKPGMQPMARNNSFPEEYPLPK